MNCSYVKSKLPDYLAGNCTEDEKLLISKHISTCPNCMKAFEELEEPYLKIADNHKLTDTKKLLNKARRTLIFKVTTTSILSLIIVISIFFAVIPGILKAVRYPNINDITRSLGDITQFTTPSPVTGYANSPASFGEYNFNISTFTYDITGTKKKNPTEIKRSFNLITGAYQSPAPYVSKFIHPEVKASDEFLSQFTPNAAKKILNKNEEATVATVDLSLKSILSLKEVAAIIKDFDVKIVWMAVECGSEGVQPKNMTAGINQYIQWGIPGLLFNPYGHSFEFSSSKLVEYEKSVMDELKWLDENKHYISADKGLLKYNDLDNGVGNKAKYIIDNGFKIYGLRVTGPTSELSKLQDKFAIRMEEVIDIDFYYWN